MGSEWFFEHKIKCLAHRVHGHCYFQNPRLESLLASRSQSSLSVILGTGLAHRDSPMILTPNPVPYLNSVEDSGSPRCTTNTIDKSYQASYGTARRTVYNSYPPTNFTSSTARSRSLAPSVSPLLLSPRNSNESLIDLSPRKSQTQNKYKGDFADISYSRSSKEKTPETLTRQQTNLIYSFQKRKRMPKRKRTIHLVVKPKGASYITHKRHWKFHTFPVIFHLTICGTHFLPRDVQLSSSMSAFFKKKKLHCMFQRIFFFFA